MKKFFKPVICLVCALMLVFGALPVFAEGEVLVPAFLSAEEYAGVLGGAGEYFQISKSGVFTDNTPVSAGGINITLGNIKAGETEGYVSSTEDAPVTIGFSKDTAELPVSLLLDITSAEDITITVNGNTVYTLAAGSTGCPALYDKSGISSIMLAPSASAAIAINDIYVCTKAELGTRDRALLGDESMIVWRAGIEKRGENFDYTLPVELGGYAMSLNGGVNGIFADANDITVNNSGDDLTITFEDDAALLPKQICLGVICTNMGGNYLKNIAIKIAVNGGEPAEYTTEELFGLNALVVSEPAGISTVVVLSSWSEGEDSDKFSGISFAALEEAPKAPESPTVKVVGADSVELNTIEGCEYRAGEGLWQDSPLFCELEFDTEYTFYARIKATDINYASPASAGRVIATAEQAPDTGDEFPWVPVVIAVVAVAAVIVLLVFRKKRL